MMCPTQLNFVKCWRFGELFHRPVKVCLKRAYMQKNIWNMCIWVLLLWSLRRCCIIPYTTYHENSKISTPLIPWSTCVWVGVCVYVTSLMVACSSSSLSEALSCSPLLFSMLCRRWVVCSCTDTITATSTSPVISFMASREIHAHTHRATCKQGRTVCLFKTLLFLNNIRSYAGWTTESYSFINWLKQYIPLEREIPCQHFT